MKFHVPALFALAFSSLFAVGCKSPYEKFADESCECKDSKCVKEVGEKHKDLLGGEKTSMKDLEAKLAALPEKDKKAFERGFECAMKTSMAEAKSESKKE